MTPVHHASRRCVHGRHARWLPCQFSAFLFFRVSSVKPSRAGCAPTCSARFVEGRNITFDVRYADGKADRLLALAAELVAHVPSLKKKNCTFGDATGLAVKAATTTIPVVSVCQTWCGGNLSPTCGAPVHHRCRSWDQLM